jgi:peptidyl-prolyl cis-trans isomerase C
VVHVPFIVLLALLAVASACNRSGTPAPASSSTTAAPAEATGPAKPVPAVIPDVLARVNGETVTKAEFDAAVAALEQRNQAPVPADQRDRVLRSVLDQLVSLKLLAQEAAARKIAVPDAEVDAQIAQMRQQFPSEEVFNQALKQQNKTVELLRADARSNMAIQKMLEEHLAGKIAVTPQQAQEFYDKNPEQFERPEQVRASHILIGVPQGADVASKAAVKRKAEGVLKQVKAGGDFGALARTNSEDPGSAVNGGDLGFFPRGQMVPPFDQAAFSLAKGATSDLVETQFGYHIIRVMEKREAGTVTLEEVRPQLEEYLQNVNRQREMQAFVDGLKAKGKVDVLI